MNYEKTIVNDSFKFHELECQFYGTCKAYKPGVCMYGNSCKAHLSLTTGARLSVRHVLSSCLEESVALDSLKFQIGLLKQ